MQSSFSIEFLTVTIGRIIVQSEFKMNFSASHQSTTAFSWQPHIGTEPLQKLQKNELQEIFIWENIFIKYN